MNRILLVNLLTPVAAMVDSRMSIREKFDLTGLLYGTGSEPIPVYLVDYRYSRQQSCCRE
ncbi:MAG: hypothetical protein DWB48_09185 [Nitrosomonas sp.]|nr:hypothetical protein [Nitrosomonas sp.]